MDDLISRRAAIDAVYDLPNCYNGYSDTYDKACIIGVLEELPSVSQTINVTLDEDKVARVVEHRKKMQERKKGKENENTVYMQ